jgi:hypothetical protein
MGEIGNTTSQTINFLQFFLLLFAPISSLKAGTGAQMPGLLGHHRLG